MVLKTGDVLFAVHTYSPCLISQISIRFLGTRFLPVVPSYFSKFQYHAARLSGQELVNLAAVSRILICSCCYVLVRSCSNSSAQSELALIIACSCQAAPRQSRSPPDSQLGTNLTPTATTS